VRGAPGAGVPEGPADEVTVGVSIAVPEPFAGELQRWRELFGDPQASAIPPHITIAPPSRLSLAGLAHLQTHLGRAAAARAPFAVGLRGTGTFRPVSAVVFVAVTEGADECTALAESVLAEPHLPDPAFPYHPHVTVAHGLAEEELDEARDKLAAYEASFLADALWLYEQGEDGVWSARRRFPFRGEGVS
jgi:2'-5' RNA ligase